MARPVLLLALVNVLAFAAPAQARDPDWTRAALADQYELGSTLPLRNAPWVGTHNSTNSVSEMGSDVSGETANQKISMLAQLDEGVRSLELDVHWIPSVRGGGFAPVVCAAGSSFPTGCVGQKPLSNALREIREWLIPRPDQVVLLYIEAHLDSEPAYDAAAGAVEAGLGPLLYRPRPTGEPGACMTLPLDVTRAQVRDSPAQVILVSGCGLGTQWPKVAFDWTRTHEERRPHAYGDFPDCGPDFTRADYDGKFIRYFEDSADVVSPDDGIGVPTAAAMTRCGVDLLSLDQVVASDPRFAALVWSWAPGEPRGAGCAAQHAGRWYSLRCTRRLRVACRLGDGRWRVPSRLATHARAPSVCLRARGTWSVPRTGYEAQQLRVAMERVRAGRAWVSAHVG